MGIRGRPFDVQHEKETMPSVRITNLTDKTLNISLKQLTGALTAFAVLHSLQRKGQRGSR
jgi:hypothetical protein